MAIPILGVVVSQFILPIASKTIGQFFSNKLEISKTRQLNTIENKNTAIKIGLSFLSDMVPFAATCIKNFVQNRISKVTKKQINQNNSNKKAVTPEVIFNKSDDKFITKNKDVLDQNAIDEKIKIISAIGYNGEFISETALYLLEFYSGINNYEILIKKIRSLSKTEINCSEINNYFSSEHEKYDFIYMLFVIAVENKNITKQQIEILHTIAYVLGYSTNDIKSISSKISKIIQNNKRMEGFSDFAKNVKNIYNGIAEVQESLQKYINKKAIEYSEIINKIKSKYNITDDIDKKSKIEVEEKIKSLTQSDLTQLALDASKSLSRLDSFDICEKNTLENLPYIQRLNNFFNIDKKKEDNITSVGRLQSNSLQLLKIIQEQNLITANTLLSVQNNLSMIIDMNVETINIVDKLVGSINSRVDALEEKVMSLETALNIMNWLTTIDMLGYEKYSPILRFFKIIKDFYSQKQSDWNTRELACLYKALKISLVDTPLAWDKEISFNDLMNMLMLNEKEQNILYNLFTDNNKNLLIDNNLLQNISIISYNAIGMFMNNFEFYKKSLPLINNYLNCDSESATQAIAKSIVEKNLEIDLDRTIPIKNLSLDMLTAMSLFFSNDKNEYFGETKIDKINNHNIERNKKEESNISIDKALFYYNGDDSHEPDYSISFKLFTILAEADNPEAQHYLGIHFYKGDGTEKDLSKAVLWFKKSAEQGYAEAQNSLGDCYFDGQGVNQDYNQAVQWYMKAAEQGDASAQNNLGDCYYNGKGVNQDFNLALKWYKKSAKQENIEAQNNIGVCYYYHWRNIGGTKEEAFLWFKKAAEKNYSKAQYNLANCYRMGIGVNRNINKSIILFEKAAEQGDNDAKKFLYKLKERYNI